MKKKPKKHVNHERWLLTYSDLITLLMIFFVVMYASSNVSAQKYESLSNSLNSALGSSSGGQNPLGVNSQLDPQTDSEDVQVIEEIPETKKFQDLKAIIDKIISDSNLTGQVETRTEDFGVVIILRNDLLFDSGKAEIKDNIKHTLTDISKTFGSLPNLVRVEGHTDNRPIHTGEYSSNWQLSSMRSANVVEYLNTNCLINSSRLSSVGYGSERPISDNSTDEGMLKNRRVEIVLLRSQTN